MSQDFASILAIPADKIEKPKPLPEGFYVAKYVKQELGTSAKKKTPYVEFTLAFIAPHSDVDEEALADAGGIENKTMTDTFYLSENAQYRVKELAADVLGLPTKGETLGDIIQACLNEQFVVQIKHNVSEDGKNKYANIVNRLTLTDE